MQVLGIERDLDLLGQADPLGRELQDSRLPAGRTAVAMSAPGPKGEYRSAQHEGSLMSRAGAKQKVELDTSKELDSSPLPAKRAGRGAGVRQSGTPAQTVRQRAKPVDGASAWMGDSGFTSSRTLAELIKPTTPVPKKRRG